MESSVGVYGQNVKIHIDDDLIKALIAKGFCQDGVFSRLSRYMTDSLAIPIGIAPTSIFTDLIDEGIKERGEKLFVGLEKIDSPTFALVDKSRHVVGHLKGLFYFNKFLFDVVLQELWLFKFQRAVMKMYITHVLLEAIGKEEAGKHSSNDINYLKKILGPSEDIEVIRLIFNQIF